MSKDTSNWRIATILISQKPSGKAANNVEQVSRIQQDKSNKYKKAAAQQNQTRSVQLSLASCKNDPCKSTKGPEHRFPKLPDR